jgi:hypothetical protein
MDIDAALKDGYSLAEVNAEAARRVGFNYQNAIKDGYTDDEIVQELRKRLSGSSKIDPSTLIPDQAGNVAPRTRAEVAQEQKALQGPEPGFLDYLRAPVETTAAIGSAALMSIPGLMVTPFTGEKGFKKVMEQAYQPRGEMGQEWTAYLADKLENLNALGPAAAARELVGVPARLSVAAAGRKAKPGVKSPIELIREEQLKKAPPAPTQPELIPNLKATEGLDGQMSLFDIDEEARVANPYEAVPGDWRIDENGIPVKVDLSMEAANVQQPLQRNLWGDELPPKSPQENPVPLTQAIDNIPDTPFKGDQREIALSRLQGDIPAPGPLEAAKLEAESPLARMARAKGQSGAVNPAVFAEGFRKVLKVADDLSIAVKGMGTSVSLEAWKGGKRVGGLVLEKTNKYDPADVVDAFAPMVGVDKSMRGQGVATKLYQAAASLGNDIVPSNRKTAEGAKMWQGFEQRGVSKGMKIPRGQRGVLYIGEQNKIENTLVKSSDDTFIPENPKADEVIQKAIGETDGKLWTYTQSGATSAAMKTGSTVIKAAADIVQNALKRSEKAIRDYVFPAETALRRLPKADLETLATVFKDEMFNGQRYDADVLQNHLTDKQLEAYIKMRDMFDDTLAAQNAIRQAKGLPPISAKEAYMSSRWQGDFRRPVYDANGKLVWYLAANSKWELNRQTRALKADFPDLMTDPAKDHMVRSSMGKTDLQSMYSTMLDILGRDDPAIQKIKAAIEDQTVAQAESVAAQTKHFEPKNNIRGFVGDRPGKGGYQEALAMFQQQIQYAKNAYRWSEMQKAADDLKPILSNETLQEQQPNNIKYVREYFKNAIGHGESKAIRAIEDSIREGLGVSPKVLNDAVGDVKSLFILQKLGMSAGYTIANMIQTANVLPYLMDLRNQGYKGNPVTAVAVGVPGGLAMAMAHYAKAVGGEYLSKVDDAFLRDAFQYAEDNGVTSRSIYDEGSLAGSFSVTGKTAELMGKTLTIPEVIVRSVAYMSYSKMLKDSGKFTNQMELFQKAEELVNKSMVDYRETERPMMFSKMGGAGNFLNTLQTFPMSFYNQYAYMAGRAAKGSVTPLATMLGLQFLLAGTSGLPYMEDLYKFYMWMKEQMPTSAWAKMQESPFLSDPKLWTMETFGKSAVYGVLSEETGLGLTSRVAAPTPSQMLQSPVGPITDIAGQGVALGSALMDPTNPTKWAQSAMKSAPVGLQGLLETSPMMKGYTYVETPDGRIIAKKTSDLSAREGTYERTPEEVEARKWGLRSQREVVDRDVTYAFQSAEKQRQERSGRLVGDYYDALRRGNTQKAKEIQGLYARLTGKEISDAQMDQQINDEFMTRQQKLLSKERTSPAALLDAVRMKKILDENTTQKNDAGY